MFWKLIPSSVVEVRNNLYIFSCRSSYNRPFTVEGFASKPLSEREAEVDIVLIETSSLFYGCYEHGERGAGSGERGTEVWERVVSGNRHKNSIWPMIDDREPSKQT